MSNAPRAIRYTDDKRPEIEQRAYVKTVLVPVANPATAAAILELAVGLAHPENGLVLALIVSTGDAELESKRTNAIKPIVAEINKETEKVKLITRQSTSVTRGILDAAREERANLMLLGMPRQKQGQFSLGTIVENVTAAASCDVLMYRGGNGADFERIVVPAEGTLPAQAACQLAALLSAHYARPVEVIYVKNAYQAYWEGRARLERSLEGIPESVKIKRNIVVAQDAVAGTLARVSDKDLLLIGISQRTAFERWLFGDFTQQLINCAPGRCSWWRPHPRWDSSVECSAASSVLYRH